MPSNDAERTRRGSARIAHDPPDLVLLDVVMPVLDGFQTCRAIKEDPATALIPVVMMTALTAVEDRIEGIRAGADDVVSKPVDDRELMARIETALRTKQAVDRTRRELTSATRHLSSVGRLDRDVTVVVVRGTPEQLAEVSDGFSSDSARRLDGDEHTAAWVFIDPDPEAHVGAVRGGVHEWTEEHEPNRLAFMESQYALARVGAGLNFVHKRVAEHIKLLALVYAATALRSYLELHGIDWPRAGPDLDPTASH